MATVVYTATDHRVRIPDLTDQDGTSVTGATVEMTLYESDGTTEVSGVTWPVTLSDDGGGEYSGVLPDTVNTQENTRYELRLVATSGSAKRTWREPVVVRHGGF